MDKNFFAFPAFLDLNNIILYTLLGVGVIFFVLFLFWNEAKRKSWAKRNLPHVGTFAAGLGIVVVLATMFLGPLQNDRIMMQSIEDNYNVQIIAYDDYDVSVVADGGIQTCEVRSSDDVQYKVQCNIPDVGWVDLDTLK